MTMQQGSTPELSPRDAKIMVLDALREDLNARRAERDHRYETRFHTDRDDLLAYLQGAGFHIPVDYLRQWDNLADLREELDRIR